MHSKKLLVLLTGVTILGVTTAFMVNMTSKTNENPLYAIFSSTYKLTLDGDGPNSLANINSRLDGRLITANGNLIDVDSENIAPATNEGDFCKLEEDGYFENIEAITGVNYIKAKYSGSGVLVMNFAYTYGNIVREEIPLISNAEFDLGIESPNFIRFTARGEDVEIESIEIGYQCTEATISDYQNKYVVVNNDTANKISMNINTLNTDMSYVEFVSEISAKENDTFYVANTSTKI